MSAPEPSYFLRRAVTGSQVSRKDVEAAVPFDRTYDELDPDQRAGLRRDYPSLEPGDEPPFPLHGLADLAAPISRAAIKMGLGGELIASVEVDAQGVARAVSVSASPGSKVTEMAQLVLMQAPYKAARYRGEPCAMTYLLQLRLMRP